MTLHAYLKTQLASWRQRITRALDAGKIWLQQARTKEVDLTTLRAALAQAGSRIRLASQQNYRVDWRHVHAWVRQHGRKLSLVLLLPVAAISLTLLIHQQISRLNNALSLRPAQFTALESLIQRSKTSSVNDTPPVLNDTELETLRVILLNRGITPNILRLNLEQEGSVEFQTDQAAFGQWIAFLEEAAQRWHLYPAQLTIRAGDSPEIVSIRAVLQQRTGGLAP